MRQLRARLVQLCGITLTVTLSGCGGASDEFPREAVSGTVTLDGQPLAVGVIQFRPSSAAEPTPAGAHIKDGAFSIPRNDGPTAGNYRVIINSSGEDKVLKTAESSGERVAKPARELIPAKFNTNSTLTAKVEAGKPNTFEFALTRK